MENVVIRQTDRGDLEFENAFIFSKNFKGAKRVNPRTNKVVNAEGTRGFCIKIDDVDTANQLLAAGWNVKINTDDDGAFCYLPVEARFNNYPPDIYIVLSGKKYEIDADHVHQLDDKRFSRINLVVHPRRYIDENTGNQKIKAFLREGWFYLEQSRFATEWEEGHKSTEEVEDIPF